LNQWPTTCWPLLDVTVMPRCTAAWLALVMAWSNLTDTGMPTPTVEPSSGVK
jgi:hypothetical protein